MIRWRFIKYLIYWSIDISLLYTQNLCRQTQFLHEEAGLSMKLLVELAWPRSDVLSQQVLLFLYSIFMLYYFNGRGFSGFSAAFLFRNWNK